MTDLAAAIRRLLFAGATACILAGAVSAQEVVAPPTPNADALAAQMRVLGSNPRDINALIAAGELSTKLGDPTAALGFFARAQAVAPTDARIPAGKAGALVLMERPGEALRMFDQAERAGLAMTPYLTQRGLAYDLVGQTSLAQRDYRRALQVDPDDETRRRLALSLGISGQRPEAMTLLDPLLRRNDRAAWRARACILAMGGDMAEAQRIATSMMPGGAALQPFFARLPALSPADRAFAVHFGELQGSAARTADARLAPLPSGSARVGMAVASAPPPRVPAVVAATPAVSPAARVAVPLPGQVGRTPLPALATPSPFAARPAPGAAGTAVASTSLTPTASPTPMTVVNPSLAAARSAPLITAPLPRPVEAPAVTAPAPIPPTIAPAFRVAEGASLPNAAAPIVAAAPVNGGFGSTVAPTRPASTALVAAPFAPSLVVDRTPVIVTLPRRPVTASAPDISVAQAIAPAPSAPVAAASSPVVGSTGVASGSALASAGTPVAIASRSRGANEAFLASLIANITVPASELAVAAPAATRRPAPGRVEVRAEAALPASADTSAAPTAEPRSSRSRAAARVAATRPLAEDTKRREVAQTETRPAARKPAAKKPEPKAPDPAKEQPARWWVQVAGGARASDLDKDWARLAKASPDLKGKSAYVAPLRATHRLLTGPFKTEAEARALVNTLARQGTSAFTYQSTAGQKVDRLGSR